MHHEWAEHTTTPAPASLPDLACSGALSVAGFSKGGQHAPLDCCAPARLASAATFRCLQEEGTGTSLNRPRGFARYVKKRKLDPLDSYIPSLLQARLQLETAGRVMGG